MDGSKVRLCCSLRWLSSVLPSSLLREEVASEGIRDTPLTVKQLLLSPFQRSTLKKEVVNLLTSPHLYICAHGAIVPNEQLDSDSTFWPLIQGLSKRGIYVVDEDETVVNHTVLTQRDPFKQVSHLALLDSLMTLYASTVVSIEKMVRTVKSISTFNASRELPSGVEDSLVLWLSKVSESLGKVNKEDTAALLMDSDPLLRRRNKVKLMNSPEIPPIDQLGAGIADGQCLAALLLYYCQDNVKCSDFYFGDRPLSKQECLHNLNKVEEVYCRILPPGAFHLSPGEILKWSYSTLLDSNIRALVAHIYYHFEGCKTVQNGRVKSPMRNNSIRPSLGSQSVEDTTTQSKMQSRLIRRELLSKADSMPRVRNGLHMQLQSYSTGSLNPSLSAARPQNPLPLVGGEGIGVNRTNGSGQSLSSFSASALEKCNLLVQSSTVFKAPLRSSLSVSQVNVLSQFERKSMDLGLKGVHTQSSPAIQVSTTLPDVPKSSRQRDFITASTDNLMIREQMLTKKLRKRNVSKKMDSKPKSLITAHESAKANRCDVVSYSDGEFAAYPSGVEVTKSEPLNVRRTEFVFDKKGIRPSSSLAGLDVLRTSFTLDKRHTKTSASAAGLPIIEPHHTVECSTMSTGLPVVEKVEEHSHTEEGTRSISSGSFTSNSSEMQLVVFPDAQSDSVECEKELKPSTAVEQLKVLLNKFKVAQTLREKEAEKNRQQIGQELHHSFVQRYKKSLSDGGDSNTSEGSGVTRSSCAEEDSHRPDTPGDVTRVVQRNSRQCLSTPASLVKDTKTSDVRGLSKPEPSNGDPQKVLHPQSSTAKKPPVGKSQPLRELTLSPIAQAESKSRDKTEKRSSPYPWMEDVVAQEEQLKQRQAKLVKARLEGKERERKKALEFRKKEQANKRVVQELRKSSEQNGSADSSGTTTPVEGHAMQISHAPHELQASPPLIPQSADSALANGERKTHDKTEIVSKKLPSNPWTENRDTLLRPETTAQEEEQRQRKEALVKSRLEERERQRKKVLEFRRKEQANKKAAQELLKLKENIAENNVKNKPSTTVASSGASSPTVSVSEAERRLGGGAGGGGDTLHYKLSSHELHVLTTPQPVDHHPEPSSSRPTTSSNSRLTEYRGPECYVKPPTKTNKNIIKNAICHVCLAGEANLSLKQRALAELETSSAVHVVILFRDIVGFKFRGLYSLSPDDDKIHKIFGNGPKVIKASMTSSLYKYNCGVKEFQLIPSRSFSVSVGALTIKNQYWAKKSAHKV